MNKNLLYRSCKSVISLLMAVMLLTAYAVIAQLSAFAGGEVSVYYGCAGVFAMAMSFVAFLLARDAEKDENAPRVLPHVAYICSGLALVLWAGTFIIGILPI